MEWKAAEVELVAEAKGERELIVGEGEGGWELG